MYYPDLRSLEDVENLPMPEFNLRIHCLEERIRWESGHGLAGVFDGTLDSEEPESEMKPVEKRQLIDVLAEIKQHQIAEAQKES